MKKIILEIIFTLAIVLVPTYFIYQYLAPVESFWSTQTAWSIALIFCWMVVAFGYYHQGFLVRRGHEAKNVSLILPLAVFVVQCILFVKGIYYNDWSLIIGALLVNSGVVFSAYNIIKYRML